jgi:copper(I)-binding protein
MSQRLIRVRVAAITALLTIGAAAGCAASSSGVPKSTTTAMSMSVTGGHAVIGDLTISRAYIPDPATSSIAAAYLTVTNSGPADRLISISTPAFRSAMLNRYDTDPNGGQTMVATSSGAVVPAHGRLVLMPGSYHVMLRKPLHPVRQGTTARLTLRFAKAGVVSLLVPVVADTGLPASSMSTSMPGMDMSGGGM